MCVMGCVVLCCVVCRVEWYLPLYLDLDLWSGYGLGGLYSIFCCFVFVEHLVVWEVWVVTAVRFRW